MSTDRKLLVGVDVGGTNTDVVIIDPSRLHDEDKGCLTWKKTITTPDVSHGIEASIRELLKNGDIKGEEIVSLTIGTTHFINAVIERNMRRLQKVAVIRISGPYGKSLPPFGDFPEDLGDVLNAYIGIIDGGFQITGKDIRKLDEEALRSHCAEIKKLNISAIAVVATFATLNNEHELRAAKIIQEEISEADIVLSHTISGIGFIERENAAILNAAIRRFGRELISSFLRLRDRLGLSCTLLLSQNDGTVLSAKNALETPIRTFSSGATNSMRGAAILCSTDPDVKGKNVIVCDVGGTTTDVGQLLASGFPRQSSTYSYVGGVRMNFSMPLVQSCGLGGGSIVKSGDGEVFIGPESTGAEIVKHAKIFGGNTVIATDVTVGILADELGVDAIGHLNEIGDTKKVCNMFSDDFKAEYKDAIRKKLEIIIGRLKTSPEPIPVIFVGGGSFIAPTALEGASKVIIPPYYQVANAIGAALAKVSSEVQKICTIDNPDVEVEIAVQKLITKARKDAISKGAREGTLEVVDIESESVPYVDKVYSIRVKVIGDVDYSRVLKDTEDAYDIVADYTTPPTEELKLGAPQLVSYDYEKYKPTVRNREWILSEIDIDFISVGAYILGCGGGGDPHSETIELKHIIRNGGAVTVLTLDDFAVKTNGKGRAVSVGYFGSPTISLERLHGDEILHALENIEKWEGRKVDAITLFEIGGGNGLSGLWVAHKRNLPCIDLDLMGRAYPTQWQSIPSVCCNKKGFPYVSLSDGNGISMIFTNTVDDVQTESLIRDVMNNHGVQCGMVEPSASIEQMRKQTISNSLSLAWRIGRAVHIARYKSDLDNLPSYIIDAAGGPSAAKCLFKGKIIGVQRKLERGYGFGVVLLEGLEDSNFNLRIPFKNENIVVYKVDHDGKEIPLCSVPDLITLVDMDGNAVGTQEYKYGLEVYLMVLAPCDAWTTPEGVKVGGPPGFGPAFEDIEYKPVGKYIKPVAVADEFGH